VGPIRTNELNSDLVESTSQRPKVTHLFDRFHEPKNPSRCPPDPFLNGLAECLFQAYSGYVVTASQYDCSHLKVCGIV